MWPTSVAELGGISGVGKKLATYGEGVVVVLAVFTGPAGGLDAEGPDDWPQEEPEPDG